MTLVLFLLSLGLLARLTRLAVDDGITQPIRDFFATHANPGGRMELHVESDHFNARNSTATEVYVENRTRISHRVSKFASEVLDCPWCFSVWASAAVFVTAYACADPGTPPHTAFIWTAAAAAASWLTGVLSTLVGVLHGLERVEGQIVDGK